MIEQRVAPSRGDSYKSWMTPPRRFQRAGDLLVTLLAAQVGNAAGIAP